MGAINKARDYKPSTVKRLYTLSLNQCTNPACRCPLIAKDEKTIISKICHIEAASTKGPRYNPNMTDDQRRHYDNLILLCDECHSLIDNKENEDKYSVKLLKEWKKDQESYAIQNAITKKPLLLNHAINTIANIDFEQVDINEEEIRTFKIKEKIKYNALKRNKFLIEEYSKYYGKINTLYTELENQGSFKKVKLLENIKIIYLKTKGKYVKGQKNELEIIQENADNIFEDVENELLEIIDKDFSNNEDISLSLPIILTDAFMRCKILERPL